MNITDIRRVNLRRWVNQHGVPRQEKSYFSQLLSGSVSFGEKSARRLEADYKMESMALDAYPPAEQGRPLTSRQDVSPYAGKAATGDTIDRIDIPHYPFAAIGAMPQASSGMAEPITRITVTRAWLDSTLHAVAANHLALITAPDDKMDKTFHKGDLLLIDCSVNDIQSDGVYVLALKDVLYIRRLQRCPDGTVLMMPDNKKYDAYVMKGKELKAAKIAGRILLAWHASKL